MKLGGQQHEVAAMSLQFQQHDFHRGVSTLKAQRIVQ